MSFKIFLIVFRNLSDRFLSDWNFLFPKGKLCPDRCQWKLKIPMGQQGSRAFVSAFSRHADDIYLRMPDKNHPFLLLPIRHRAFNLVIWKFWLNYCEPTIKPSSICLQFQNKRFFQEIIHEYLSIHWPIVIFELRFSEVENMNQVGAIWTIFSFSFSLGTTVYYRLVLNWKYFEGLRKFQWNLKHDAVFVLWPSWVFWYIPDIWLDFCTTYIILSLSLWIPISVVDSNLGCSEAELFWATFDRLNVYSTHLLTK
jgi:hypothetical protein